MDETLRGAVANFRSGITRLIRTGTAWQTFAHTGLALLGQSGMSAAKYVCFVLVAHGAAPEKLSLCSVYLASNVVIGNISDLGINIAYLKFASQAQDEGARAWTERRFLLLRLLFATLIAVLTLAAADPFCRIVLHHSEFAISLRLAAVSTLVGSLSAFALTMLQSRFRFAIMARQSSVSACVQVAVALVTLFCGVPCLVCLFAADIVSRLLVLGLNQAALRSALSAQRPRDYCLRFGAIAAFAQWITISSAVGAFYNYIPTIVLSRLSSDGSELNKYMFGLALAGGVSLVLSAVMTVLLPEVMRATSLAQRTAYVRKCVLTLMPLALSLALLIWMAAPMALSVVGQRYSDSVSVFRVLATSHVVLLVTNAVQFVLYSMDLAAISTAGDILISALFWMLSAGWLAPRYGAIGVAWALFAGQTLVKVAIVAVVAYLLHNQHRVSSPHGLSLPLPVKPL